MSRPTAAVAACGLLTGTAVGGVLSHVGGLPTAALALLALLVLLPLLPLAHRVRPGLTAVLLGLSTFCIGGWFEASDLKARALRLGDSLPAKGSALEGHVEGRLLGAPERDFEGHLLLNLRGRPVSRAGRPQGPPLTLLLRVAVSPDAHSTALDDLRAGDRLRAWCSLRRPRGLANPGSADPDTALRARGLDASGWVKSPRVVERLSPGTGLGGPLGRIDRMRRWSRHRLDRAFGSQGSVRALLGAMLLGDRAGLSPEDRRVLRDAGMVHLVAISGLHVGLVVGMFHAMAGRAGLKPWVRWSLMLPLLVVFAVGTGLQPSVQRAAVGAATLLLGRCLGREGPALHTLLLVAAVLALANPGALHGPGFQLTFLATAGILAQVSRAPRAGGRSRPVTTALAVSWSAYLATAPLVAWHFGRLAPVGLATNLAAVPLCGVVLASGYTSIVLDGVPGLGTASSWCCARAGELLLGLAETAGALPMATVAAGRPGIPFLLAYYALLAKLVFRDPVDGVAKGGFARFRVAGWITRPALAFGLIWLHVGGPPPPAGEGLEAAVWDVGQGLAVTLHGPGGGVVLVDAGGSASPRFDPGERVLVPALRSLGVRRLEALVLTHDHVDHAGGAFAVLRDLEVGELWLGPGSSRSPRARSLAELARRRGTAVVLARGGFESHRVGMPLRVLAPDRDSPRGATNDISVVVLAGAEPARILITGDLERSGEARLLASGRSPTAEALVVGHHGSRDATDPRFLRRVAPRWALISTGYRNRFGHPHPEVLDRLAAEGVRVARTDRGGRIHLREVARGWRVTTQALPVDEREGRSDEAQDEQHQ